MTGRSLENSVRLSHASGMVSMQAHCSFNEAVTLMKHRARTSGQTLDQIVIAVVDRHIRFDPGLT